MSRGTVLTPLLTEWLAVSPALDDRAVRTGRSRGLPARVREQRPRSSADVADGHPAPAAGPVLVAGVAGALTTDLRPGDLVVADAVVAEATGGRVELPVAPLLAGALRRAGQRVHVGPIVTTEHVVDDPAERARLAAEGFVAVDTESSLLLEDGRPAAVVRAIVDTPEHKLLSLGTVRRGIAALAALRRAAPVLQRWLDAVADREVLLASPRSFCAGVERAIDIVDRALDRFDQPVYVRRQIVHNRHVVAELEEKGAIFVEEVDEVPEGGLVVLAAHGVAPVVREDAARRRLQVIDATCPLVAKVHAEVKRFASRGDTVFLIGHDHHEEVVGTLGEAPDRVIVVNDPDEAATVQAPDPDKVAYVMQTTLAVDEAEKTATVLRERFPALDAPRKDDVCYATTNRQQAVREVARASDLVIVLGSRNSSNSLRLVEVAEGEGARAHLVDDLSEIDLAWLAGAARVGITAGASAPPKLVDDVVAGLGGLGRTTVRETEVVSENVRFTLPPILQSPER